MMGVDLTLTQLKAIFGELGWPRVELEQLDNPPAHSEGRWVMTPHRTPKGDLTAWIAILPPGFDCVVQIELLRCVCCERLTLTTVIVEGPKCWWPHILARAASGSGAGPHGGHLDGDCPHKIICYSHVPLLHLLPSILVPCG